MSEQEEQIDYKTEILNWLSSSDCPLDQKRKEDAKLFCSAYNFNKLGVSFHYSGKNISEQSPLGDLAYGTTEAENEFYVRMQEQFSAKFEGACETYVPPTEKALNPFLTGFKKFRGAVANYSTDCEKILACKEFITNVLMEMTY